MAGDSAFDRAYIVCGFGIPLNVVAAALVYAPISSKASQSPTKSSSIDLSFAMTSIESHVGPKKVDKHCGARNGPDDEWSEREPNTNESGDDDNADEVTTLNPRRDEDEGADDSDTERWDSLLLLSRLRRSFIKR